MEQDLLCGIYKITSPVGKVYIGQSKNFEKRFSDYRRGRCPQQRKLFNSLFKYGFINHTIEIIEICEVEDLDCRERFWQDYYNVKHRDLGLNCVLVACGDKKEERLVVPVVEKLKATQVIRPKMSELEREFNRFRMSVNRTKSLTQKEKQSLLSNFKEGDLERRYLETCKNKNRNVSKSIDKNSFIQVNHNSKLILDTQTGVFYYGIKDLAELYDLNYEIIKSRLNGKLKNNTQFIYI